MLFCLREFEEPLWPRFAFSLGLSAAGPGVGVPMAYTVRELSLRTFPDFETLAIKQGGCWCMFYQRSKPVGRGATSDQWKRINRRDKRTFVRQGRSHAILVFEGGTPVGWCQYGGQEELPRIDARRTYRKVAPS